MKSIFILLDSVITIYLWIIIINAVLSWLVAFNILNTQNRFVFAVLDATYKITDPALNKIRKFDKSIAIIPNFQFAENAVINISETTNWIISWVITLQYNTTVEQLKKIRDEIEKYLTTHKDFKISLGHAVRVDKFSDSSIDMYIRCFTVTADWDEWLAVKERLAIEIKQIVEKNNASFAFPSQSIYVEKK